MKNLIKAVLLGTMLASAASSAFAQTDTYNDNRNDWGIRHCQLATSSGSIAEHCSGYVPKQGIISRGKHEGKQWGEAFPDAHFIDANSSGTDVDIRFKKESTWLVGRHKYVWKFYKKDGNSYEIPFTKEIDARHQQAYTTKYGL